MTAPITDKIATAGFRYGWVSAMARAITLAAQLSPEGVDYRLRTALLKAMDEAPDLNTTMEAK